MISPVYKGSSFFPKQCPQSLFTVFYDILLKSSSTSSSPSCNRWLGRPHDCSLSLAVGDSMQRQMEAKLASMNLRFTRTPSSTYLVPSRPALLTPAPRTVSRWPSTRAFLSYLPILPISSATQATPRRPSLTPKSRPPARLPIAHLHRLSPRVHQSSVHGPVSVRSARSRSATLPHTRYFRRP